MEPDDLNDRILDAVTHCCQNDEDVRKAKAYFGDTTVNDMIDEALKD